MQIDLSGAWAFRLDPEDRGVSAGWYKDQLDETIQLPGSLQEQGIGNDISVDTQWTGDIIDRSWFTDPRYKPYRQPGNVKVPFWLQPDKHYVGPAWYQRQVEIAPQWQGQRLTLTLERPHWETTVWLDDRHIGSETSLATPHVYELGADLAPGRYRLTIRVDNRMLVNVGPNAHSVTDHTQSNWNGIVGDLRLAAASPVWVSDVQVYPDVAARALTLKINLASLLDQPASGEITVTARRAHAADDSRTASTSASFEIRAAGGVAGVGQATASTHVDLTLSLGEDAALWDEFDPALYALTVDCQASAGAETFDDSRTITTGLREVGVRGTQVTLNGRPLFLRGTLDCCIFPRTGYPPTDVAEWKRIIRVCQAHGLNHMRFHSWCPPEAAFVAADELGFYFQIECSSWANQGASIGEGRPLDEWLYREGRRITAAYGNHPSFLMLAYGNEPAGRIEEFLGEWVTYWRRRDPRRLYTSGAGWPAIPENDYHNIPQPRIQAWGEELNSRINARPPETRTDYQDWVARAEAPIVSHEIGQWCVYPNFDEIEKYDGVLKARNFEIFRDFLHKNHMGDQARDFLMASGKLQALSYKEEIESALRTPGFAGFQLLDLHDFPGQGTALVGVLDPFWEEKGYITPDAFRRFCNSTVPLARMDKRYWRRRETLRADVDVAHFGPEPLADAILVWQLLDRSGKEVAQGRLDAQTLATGAVTRCGSLSIPLAACDPGQTHSLAIGIEGTEFENDWDLWVFADRLDTTLPTDLLVVSALTGEVLSHLSGGGNVLLMPPATAVKTDAQIGFSSVFWNTAWTHGQAPHTLGILCDPDHPLFGDFPTEFHSNWQWWELIHGSAAMTLDALPPDLRPLVQVIDTWFEARRLGLLFEARVNGGNLMVCSMDLRTDLDQRLVVRQFWHSLLDYLDSSKFAPSTQVDAEKIHNLLRPDARTTKIQA